MRPNEVSPRAAEVTLPDEVSTSNGSPLIVIGDQVRPKPYLIALMQQLRAENKLLDVEQQIRYAVCADSADVALALRKYLESVKMVLIGPGLVGNGVTVARMLSKKANIVMVVDPAINPLGTDPTSYQSIQKNLEDLGIILVTASKATAEFFEPLVTDYVLADLSMGADLEDMTPEERGQMIDRRLDAVNKFPSLPDTQRKVAELDDLDSPKRWAEAIDSDLTTRTVILRILNSARYGFRSPVLTIEQAVALASAKTIREIVTACQIRQLFQKTDESNIDQFWRHSLSVGFFAKLFSLPADPEAQSKQQKNEFDRFQLEADHIAALKQVRIWSKVELGPEDDAFTGGLLHDIGKITMLMALEESLTLIMALVESEVEEARKENKLWAHSVLEVERFLMQDIDHQVVGGRVAERWELPAEMIHVIGRHHDVNEQSPPLLKLVALANLAGSMIFPYPATEIQHPFPQLFEQIDQAIKKKSAKNMDEAVDEAISQDVFEDLVDVLNRLQVSDYLWELVDFKSFFKVCYLVAPKIRSAAISFLQQTG
jgi:HD-like signal output (HDOD) protein